MPDLQDAVSLNSPRAGTGLIDEPETRTRKSVHEAKRAFGDVHEAHDEDSQDKKRRKIDLEAASNDPFASPQAAAVSEVSDAVMLDVSTQQCERSNVSTQRTNAITNVNEAPLDSNVSTQQTNASQQSASSTDNGIVETQQSASSTDNGIVDEVVPAVAESVSIPVPHTENVSVPVPAVVATDNGDEVDKKAKKKKEKKDKKAKKEAAAAGKKEKKEKKAKKEAAAAAASNGVSNGISNNVITPPPMLPPDNTAVGGVFVPPNPVGFALDANGIPLPPGMQPVPGGVFPTAPLQMFPPHQIPLPPGMTQNGANGAALPPPPPPPPQQQQQQTIATLPLSFAAPPQMGTQQPQTIVLIPDGRGGYVYAEPAQIQSANSNAVSPRNVDNGANHGAKTLTLPVGRNGNATPRSGKGGKNRDATPRNPIYGALSGLTPSNAATPKGKGKSGKGKRKVNNTVVDAANEAMSPNKKRSVYDSFASKLSEDRGTKSNLKVIAGGATFDPLAPPGHGETLTANNAMGTEERKLLENDPFHQSESTAADRLAQFGATVSGNESENEAKALQLNLTQQPLALNLKDAQSIEDASTRCGTTNHHGGLSTSAGCADDSVRTDRATMDAAQRLLQAVPGVSSQQQLSLAHGTNDIAIPNDRNQANQVASDNAVSPTGVLPIPTRTQRRTSGAGESGLEGTTSSSSGGDGVLPVGKKPLTPRSTGGVLPIPGKRSKSTDGTESMNGRSPAGEVSRSHKLERTVSGSSNLRDFASSVSGEEDVTSSVSGSHNFNSFHGGFKAKEGQNYPVGLPFKSKGGTAYAPGTDSESIKKKPTKSTALTPEQMLAAMSGAPLEEEEEEMVPTKSRSLFSNGSGKSPARSQSLSDWNETKGKNGKTWEQSDWSGKDNGKGKGKDSEEDWVFYLEEQRKQCEFYELKIKEKIAMAKCGGKQSSLFSDGKSWGKGKGKQSSLFSDGSDMYSAGGKGSQKGWKGSSGKSDGSSSWELGDMSSSHPLALLKGKLGSKGFGKSKGKSGPSMEDAKKALVTALLKRKIENMKQQNDLSLNENHNPSHSNDNHTFDEIRPFPPNEEENFAAASASPDNAPCDDSVLAGLTQLLGNEQTNAGDEVNENNPFAEGGNDDVDGEEFDFEDEEDAYDFCSAPGSAVNGVEQASESPALAALECEDICDNILDGLCDIVP